MSENLNDQTAVSQNSGGKTKKKSLAKKILLWILGILVVIILALTVFFIRNPHWWNHIMAVRRAIFQSEEETMENLNKIQQERIDEVQKEGLNLTKEAEQALADGLIDAEQFRQILLGQITLEEAISQNQANDENDFPENVNNVTDKTQTEIPDNPDPEIPALEGDDEKNDEPVKVPENPTVSENDKVTDNKPDSDEKEEQQSPSSLPQKPVENKPVTNTPTPVTPTPQQPASQQPKPQTPPADAKPSSEVDERIAELVTRMYVLKSTYVSQIDGLVSQMKAEYVKLPPEQRTTSAKQSIATGYMSRINAMEAQCDAQVNSVVTELRALLKNNGRDTSLADTIVSTYHAEKENTKAYYINTYGD